MGRRERLALPVWRGSRVPHRLPLAVPPPQFAGDFLDSLTPLQACVPT